jgi:hypothetical protein
MASVEQMTDEQFERYALEVLQRELGADGLARFLLLNLPARAITHWIECSGRRILVLMTSWLPLIDQEINSVRCRLEPIRHDRERFGLSSV